MSEKNCKTMPKIKCPECSNYFCRKLLDNGTQVGQCPICKAVISQKQISLKEKTIRVRKNSIAG